MGGAGAGRGRVRPTSSAWMRPSPTRRGWPQPARVGDEIARSLAVARASRVERRVGDVLVVAAVCDGHPSEVADAWGKETPHAVFALWDAKSLAVSLRRSPDSTVDLSQIARALGGGGHAAAAGCEVPDLRQVLAESLVARISDRLP